MKTIKYSKRWKPSTEDGTNSYREFNSRFPIELCFKFNTLLKKYRIRFVQHHDVSKDSVRVFTSYFYKKLFFWKWNNRGCGKYPDVFSDEKVIKIIDCEKIYGLKL
jgi:hypothetical protein